MSWYKEIMKYQLLILCAVTTMSGCSWVDDTGSQTNSDPDIQLDANAALLTEREVYEITIADDGAVETNFVLLQEGPDAAGNCNDYLAPVDSAMTLAAACDIRLDPSECALQFRADDTVNNKYLATIPQLRQSVALKYNVIAEDINGAIDSGDVVLCLRAVNDAPIAIDHDYQVEYRGTLETSNAAFDENCAVISGSGVLSGASDDFDYATAPLGTTGACLTSFIDSNPSSAIEFSLNDLGGFKYVASGSLAPGATDSFSYIVSDGDQLSTPKTVNILVVGENDPPVILDFNTLIVDENSSGSIAVTSVARDPEGETLKVFSVDSPSNGVANQNPAGTELSYTPNENYVGEDSFDFTVQDIAGARASGTIDVLVARSNQAPTIDAPSTRNYNFNNGDPNLVSFDVDLDDRETPAEQLQLAVRSSRTNIATATAPSGVSADGTAVVSVNPIANGTTELTLTVSDRGLNGPVQRPVKSTSATVFVTVAGIFSNEPPVASDTTREVTQGETLRIDLSDLSNDADGDSLEYSLVSDINGVTLSGSRVNIGTAATRTVRRFTVVYRVEDASSSDTGTITVVVNAVEVNSPPTASDDERSIQAGGTAVFDLTALTADADGDSLTYRLLNAPASATLNSNNTVTVTSDEDDEDQTIVVRYRVNDGEANATGTLTVVISERQNNAPTISNSSASITAGEVATVNLATLAEDDDNDTLTYSLVGNTAGATLTGTTLRVTTAATSPDATIRVTYRVSDGTDTDTGVFTVTVSAVPNSAPTTRNIVRDLTAGQTTSLDLANISDDPDQDTLTYSLSSQPAGTSLVGSVIRYVSAADAPTETIVIGFVVDDQEETATGNFTINVTALPVTQ